MKWILYLILLLVGVFAFSKNANAQIITTVAGNGTLGYSGDGGPATGATIYNCKDVACDGLGNFYIVDQSSYRIRKVDRSGVITTIAGNGTAGHSGDGGPATSALVYWIESIAVDPYGNLYFTESPPCIRKIDTSGIITTIAGTGTSGDSGDGGPATAAQMRFPVVGIALDNSGNIFFCDAGNRRVRKIDNTGVITAVAGSSGAGSSGDGGPATAATFHSMYDLGVDGTGNIYIADYLRVRKINASGIISTCAGNGTSGYSGDGGPATAAAISAQPYVATDTAGNLYISDNGNGHIRKVDTTGIITNIAGATGVAFYGDGGLATATVIGQPRGLDIDGAGNVYFCTSYCRILWINNNDKAPYFTGGASQSITVCENGLADSINSELAIVDSDASQIIDWSVVDSADHGTLGARLNTFSTGSTIVPHGMYYTPEPGYNGYDTFSVRITDGVFSDTIKIYVTVVPTALTITGNDHVCTGATTILGDTVTGGVWSCNSTAIATIGSSTGIVTGVTAGTAIVSYSVVLSCGPARSTMSMMVYPTPAPIAGSAVVCTGYTVTLSDAMGGGAWTSGSPSVAIIGATSGILSGISSGIATITYSVFGCIVTKIVSVDAAPSTISGSTNICIGSTTALSSGTTGGSWSSSNPLVALVGTLSGIVTAGTTGTATISYTISTGCFATAVVTVNPLPLPVSGTFAVCSGSTTALSSSPSGTWSSGSPTIASAGSATGIVTGITTGTTIITFASPAGCTATAAVTVNLTPAAIGGSANACIGQTDTLSEVTPGGIWISGDTSVVYVNSMGERTGLTLGTANITYMLPATGCYTTMNVTVNPVPSSITGVSGTCVSASANLYNSISGGTWTSGNTAVATINSSTGVYTGVSAGTAIMSYSTGAGCTVAFPVTIYALPAPITGTLNVCVAASTALSSITSGGMWSASGGGTVGPTGLVTGASAGTAIISYTMSTGCRVTATVTVNPLPTAITGTMQVCPAAMSALSGSPGSGTWLSSNTAVATIGSGTGIAGGVATGTSVIRYTLPTGCSITRLLTVNALPTAIIGPGSVCVSGSAGLTMTTPGGTWSRSNTNISIGTTSGVVTGVNAGTSVVTYTLPTGCYVTKTITINSSPGTITGTMQLCVGGSAGLTMTSSGSGVWSSGSLPIATIGSLTGILTGVAAGTAGITYSVGTGCAATATVTVHALPGLFTVTGGGSYCVGGTGVHIGMSGSATGVNYQLYLGSGATGSPLAGTGAPIDFGFQSAPGIYTVVATSAQGCTSTMTGSAVIAINPLPGPIGGPSAVCVGGSAGLTMTSGGGVWSSGATGVATIGSATGIVTGVATGTTTITYTAPTTCTVTKMITVSSTPTAIIGPSTICAGASATLTVTPAGGVWSSSAGVTVGSLSGIVTGVAAGPATVTYSLGTGCMVTKTMTVLPSPAAIGGSSQACVAGSTSLTMTTSGGVWTSGSISIATVSGTGVVSGVSAGTAVISYTAGGCSSTKTMTVNAVPSAITGPGAVCMAGSTSLTVTSSGGTWSTTATTLTIGSTDGVVTGVSAGTGVVTYSLGTGLTACSVTRTITVNAAPVISGASGVCVTSSTSLTVTPIMSGVWSSGAGGIAGVSSAGVVTGVSTGVAAITFTPVTGCIATKTMTVNTTPGAITGTTQVCVGASTALSVTSGSGGVWTSGSIIVATIGSLSGLVNGVAAGLATITYSLGTGCTVTKVVTVNPLPAAITGGAAVCIASSTTLTVTSGGGVWSSGSIGTATVTTLGVVTGVAMGTATISYTLTTGCAATKIVTVNSLPGSISGAGRVCDGATTTLTVTSGSGVWSSSNPSIASIGSGTGIVTGVYAGTATITFSQGPGCEVTRMMTVDPLPGGITGTSNICIASSTTLTVTSGGGVWSSGATGIATVGPSSGIVTGVSGGSATISYTVITTGCASTYNITVITVPALTGLTNLCAWGDTVTVYNANPAGTYSSSLVTVLNLGGGAGRVTAFAPGTGYITYTLAGVGCSRTTAVTVNTLPGLIAGATNLCVGSTSTLSNSVGGGVWSSGVTGVATIGSSSGLLTGVGAGSTYIRYTIPNGCKVDTMAYVSVFPVVGTIAGAGDICVAGSTTLTVTSSGGVWSSGATGIAGVSVSGVVTGVSAGVAAISYAVTNVCGTATATRTMTINPVPDAGVITGTDSLCVSSSAGLTVTIGGGVWSTVNGNAVVSATGLVTGVAAGMDTVVYTVTSAEGCVNSAEYVVKVKPWGLCGALASPQPTLPPTAPSLEKREGVLVWPNPARDELHVENAMGCEVRIYNILGQSFGKLTMTSDKEILNIERLTPGVYVVEVVGDFGKESRRLVVGR